MNPRAEYLDVGPHCRAAGVIKLPGSKSISNRTLLLAALAGEVTTVNGLLDSDDTSVMIAALRLLGAQMRAASGSEGEFVIDGRSAFSVTNAAIFLGNAGTAFRPLTAALALLAPPGSLFRLAGVSRMHERPIGDLVDALRALGADIRYLGMDGFPPLEIRGCRDTTCQVVQVRGDVSSQFLSALLLALPVLAARKQSTCTVEVVGELISKPYVEITLNLMSRFGVEVERHGWERFVVKACSHYRSPAGNRITVEGDASSASYFLAAGAIAGGPVRVLGVGRNSIQGDVLFANVLGNMGASVSVGDDWIEAAAPIGGKLMAIDADLNHIPDAAMTIAICALFAQGTTTIRNIASWRVKETDRIAAMATELRKCGAKVEEGTDYIRITPPPVITLADSIDTYDDHRMAMCFSLVSLAGVGVRINDPGCVAKTFPAYFGEFGSIVS